MREVTRQPEFGHSRLGLIAYVDCNMESVESSSVEAEVALENIEEGLIEGLIEEADMELERSGHWRRRHSTSPTSPASSLPPTSPSPLSSTPSSPSPISFAVDDRKGQRIIRYRCAAPIILTYAVLCSAS